MKSNKKGNDKEIIVTIQNYWFMYIWILLIGIVSFIMPKNVVERQGIRYAQWGKFMALIAVVPLIVWATYRTSAWGDTGAYREMFYSIPDKVSAIPGYLVTHTKDRGFSALAIFLKSIYSETSVFFFLVIAIVQLVSLALTYREYSSDYWLAMFIFVASTDYMSWCHNGARQFTAVMLIFAASKWIFEKKYIPAILVILLASTIHGSALLMIPIIFIIQGEAGNKKTLLCVIAVIVALAFVNQFTNLLDTMLSDTQYTNVVTDWTLDQDDGTNPIRVLVYAMPTILALLGRKYIKFANDKVVNICVNASIVSSALALLSMGTSGIFIGRLPIYCSLYSNGILVPWEINAFFTEKSAHMVKVIVVLCYTAFFYYQMHFTWGLL